MITRVHIQNYRTFKNFDFEPQNGINIIVGNNEAGKSTLLEAITLVLNGRLNGRWIGDELNPYWFNLDTVTDYFNSISSGISIAPPMIMIEVYFSKEDEPQRLRGKNNYYHEDCPGISLSIELDPDCIDYFNTYLRSEHPPILPTEYYRVKWTGFDGTSLNKRPIELKTLIIDGRTIRSSRGVDIQTRQILSDYIDGNESADLSVAYRQTQYKLTEGILSKVNIRIKEDTQVIQNHKLELQMDQSSSSSWENSIVPHIDLLPFSMAGMGQQVLMKIALALKATNEKCNFIIIEEPENHLSHTSLTKAIKLIDTFSTGKQTFIATHSSYVLNRLGLDRLVLLHNGDKARFDNLTTDTIDYFRKQSGYDTLRLVLARKLVIVEGPTDEMLFNRAYLDITGNHPTDDEIDVITQGTRNRRALELCHVLNRSVAVLRDADKQSPEYWIDKAKEYLKEGSREMFIGISEQGETLESQIHFANQNSESELKEIVGYPEGIGLSEFMIANKTESAWCIANSKKKINYPQYFINAITFIQNV